MDRTELRQPVASIRSSAQLALGRLTREDATSVALRQYLELIIAEARRVDALLRPEPALASGD